MSQQPILHSSWPSSPYLPNALVTMTLPQTHTSSLSFFRRATFTNPKAPFPMDCMVSYKSSKLVWRRDTCWKSGLGSVGVLLGAGGCCCRLASRMGATGGLELRRAWFASCCSNRTTRFKIWIVNTLRPRQNGRHFADAIFKCIFLNENAGILLEISLKFVPQVRINNIPALVQIKAWRRPGDKPLSEPVTVSLPTHICVTRPQWVKGIKSPARLRCRDTCKFFSKIWSSLIEVPETHFIKGLRAHNANLVLICSSNVHEKNSDPINAKFCILTQQQLSNCDMAIVWPDFILFFTSEQHKYLRDLNYELINCCVTHLSQTDSRGIQGAVEAGGQSEAGCGTTTLAKVTGVTGHPHTVDMRAVLQLYPF